MVFRTNPETGKTVSRGPANLEDEYFHRIPERPNNARWNVVVQLVFVTGLAVLHPRMLS